MEHQRTLVAFYGTKTNEFTKMITDCQNLIARQLHDNFEPYQLEQVHATIIGMENTEVLNQNANILKYRGIRAEMQIVEYIKYLRHCGLVPFQVQIGGFSDRPYPFESRNKSPYERSFSIQKDKAVVMGWPVRGMPSKNPPATDIDRIKESRIYSDTLDRIRHAAQAFGILHAYHSKSTDVDNDLFFRIGLIHNHSEIDSIDIENAEEIVRLYLSDNTNIVELTLRDIYIAHYIDDRLPSDSTRLQSIVDSSVY